ncbi:hypothetical protein C1N62_21135 (plasmid) [Nissabacter sp. SGAir0207]|nr:hypothetical protein C1N62_21135 [Nissabacter sp. SGAir0207]
MGEKIQPGIVEQLDVNARYSGSQWTQVYPLQWIITQGQAGYSKHFMTLSLIQELQISISYLLHCGG